jgi:hypothetical protein
MRESGEILIVKDDGSPLSKVDELHEKTSMSEIGTPSAGVTVREIPARSGSGGWKIGVERSD